MRLPDERKKRRDAYALELRCDRLFVAGTRMNSIPARFFASGPRSGHSQCRVPNLLDTAYSSALSVT
jgi:hypothetical protein